MLTCFNRRTQRQFNMSSNIIYSKEKKADDKVKQGQDNVSYSASEL